MKRIPDRQIFCNLSQMIFLSLERAKIKPEANVHLSNFLRDFPKEEAWDFERTLLTQAMDGTMSDFDLAQWIDAMPSSWIRARMMDVQENREKQEPTTRPESET